MFCGGLGWVWLFLLSLREVVECVGLRESWSCFAKLGLRMTC